MKVDQPPHTAGNALLFVLWIIAFLSLLVFSLSARIGADVVTEVESNDIRAAVLMAERGIAVGSHIDAQNGDNVMSMSFEDGSGFEVNKSKEAALINPNFLVTTHPTVMAEVFKLWGVPRDLADNAVEALADWTDPDDEAVNGGSEAASYAQRGRDGHPYNRRFLELEEMLLIDEFVTVAIYRPDWADLFTVLSNGPVDLEFAGPEVIELMVPVNFKDVERFIEFRNGPDNQPGTEDDGELLTVNDCLEFLGLPEDQWEIYSEYLSLGTTTEKLISRGFANGNTAEIVLTYQSRSGRVETLGKEIKVGGE